MTTQLQRSASWAVVALLLLSVLGVNGMNTAASATGMASRASLRLKKPSSVVEKMVTEKEAEGSSSSSYRKACRAEKATFVGRAVSMSVVTIRPAS